MNKSASRSSIWTPANIVTLLRICLIPVFVIALLSPWPEWFGIHNLINDQQKAIIAAVVFAVISCTDWIDGYLARSRGEVTDFGKFIDPLADKMLVAAALIALVELQVIPSWPVLIILVREFIVSGIRMVAANKGVVIAASWYGKAKTVLQIAAIVLFIIKDTLYIPTLSAAVENPLYVISWVVMIAALIMTIVSMLDYIAKAKPLLFPNSKKTDNEAIDLNEKTVSEYIYSPDDEAVIKKLSTSIIALAQKKNTHIACAESLTGGMILSALTSIPGSSAVIKGGAVTYTNEAKASLLGVHEHLLETEGAVNEDVVIEMTSGVARSLNANLSVAVSGIAGPGGAEPGKPVGTVYMATYFNGQTEATRLNLDGNRPEIRTKTVVCILNALQNHLDMS